MRHHFVTLLALLLAAMYNIQCTECVTWQRARIGCGDTASDLKPTQTAETSIIDLSINSGQASIKT
eukprot:SAG11_NODE_10247_length_844_cov_1.507383_2_plen_65_part_01